MSKFKPTKVCEIPPEDFIYPVYATPKIDGVNAIVLGGELLSRTLKKFKNKQLNQVISKGFLLGCCFEITVGKPEDRKKEDICRKTTSYVNSFDKIAEDITVSLFDFVGYFTEKESPLRYPYIERISLIHHLNFSKNISGCNIHVVFLQPTEIDNAYEAENYYTSCLELGYEGAIFRRDMPYKCGRSTAKSQETIRMKPSADTEAIVVGYKEAMQNNNEKVTNALGQSERSSHKDNKTEKGVVGSFFCIDSISGEEITVGAGKLNHDERKLVWDNREEYLNKIIKYRSMTAGVKDKPRFPRFIDWRDASDIDLSQCHKNFIKLIK